MFSTYMQLEQHNKLTIWNTLHIFHIWPLQLLVNYHWKGTLQNHCYSVSTSIHFRCFACCPSWTRGHTLWRALSYGLDKLVWISYLISSVVNTRFFEFSLLYLSSINNNFIFLSLLLSFFWFLDRLGGMLHGHKFSSKELYCFPFWSFCFLDTSFCSPLLVFIFWHALLMLRSTFLVLWQDHSSH